MKKLSLLVFSVVFGISQAHAAVGPGCAIRTDGSSICQGDRILDYRDVTGFVEQMLPNGAMVVHYDDGSTFAVNPYYLYREVASYGSYVFGSRVYDSRGNVGTVFDLFENGMAELTFDAYPGRFYLLNANQISSANLPAVPVTHTWPAPRPYPDPVSAQPLPAPAPQPVN